MTKFLDKRLGEIFKTRKPKSKNTFVDPFKDCKLLNDKEKVWVQIRPNVRTLCVVNIKEISYKDAKWEITLKRYK